MKKKILFVIDSLICAGAEKSLVSLLNQLDYDRFEIDLQLFFYGGEFEQFLPEEVNLLTPLMYTRFLNSGCSRRLLSCFNDTKARRMLQAKWTFSYQLRTQKPLNNIKIARLYWESISNSIENNPKEYDFAIAYAQGVPTFYVVDKVKALRKFGWVNVSYHLSGYEKSYQSRFYQMLDGIVTVSDSAYEVFRLVYPEFAEKMRVLRDIVDTDLITKLSVQDNGYNDNFQGVRILTVARLNKHQKGYDIALEACRLLKERGIKFKWYALGRGNYEQEMRTYIANNNLDNDFILLGTTANPYHSINPAIRSRCHIIELKPLTQNDIISGLKKALVSENGLNNIYQCHEDVLKYIANLAAGDIRYAYNCLELCTIVCQDHSITIEDAKNALLKANGQFDKDEDQYYDTLSGLQKSIRGSDPNGAMYYLAKLLEYEDLESLERRVIVCAYEDIGLANPNACMRTVMAFQAAKVIGLPEARIPIASCIIDLCLSPKSKSSEHAIDSALASLKAKPLKAPSYLRLTPVGLDEDERYDYSRPELWEYIQYLPDEIAKSQFYVPWMTSQYEKALAENYRRILKHGRTSHIKSLNHTPKK